MNGNETTELKALTKNEVMVTFKGLVINRVPCCGYIRFDVADDGVSVKLQGNSWDHRIRRPNEYKDEVPGKTKLAAIDHAEDLVKAWVLTPDGAYALLHAEAEHRTRIYEQALAELSDANRNVHEAKKSVAAAKKEHATACKARRKLWDKQNPRVTSKAS